MKIKVDITKLCATYIYIWAFAPPMQVNRNLRLLAVACFGLWVLIRGIKITGISKNFFILSLLTMVVRVGVMSFYFGLAGAINNSLQFFIMIAVGLISITYLEQDLDFVQWMALVCLCLFCFFSITTIQGTIENPYASRIANSEWLRDRFEGNENIGLYGYVYMSVLIVPLLFNKVLSRIKVSKLFDMVSVVALVLMTLMIMSAGYMIAIFCTALGCALVYVSKNRRSPKAIIVTIVLVIFVLFYKAIISSILDKLMEATEGNVVYFNKFRDFKMLLVGGDASGETVYGRWKNYAASFREIIEYPILGSYLYNRTLGGGHSFILDSIGKFGVLTAVLQFALIYFYPYRIYRPVHKGNVGIAFLSSLLVFTFFDPLPQEISIAIYLFFPFFRYLEDAS